MFAVSPMAWNGMNETRHATGIVITGIAALGTCQRKRRITRTTVTITSIRVVRRLSIERRMRSDRS